MGHIKRVLIDLDDTTCQFRQGYIDLVNELFGTQHTLAEISMDYYCDLAIKLTKAQQSQVWQAINKRGWSQSLQPMPGAVEAIQRLKSRYEVAFLTKQSLSSETWNYDRYRWVKKWFGAELAENIHFTRKKHAVCGDYLIEDHVENCKAWLVDRQLRSKHPARVILYAWPYNEYHDICSTKASRLPDWPSIVKAFGC